jgi:hypothetical protein
LELAPIILFVYNRPWHAAQTLEALANNDLAEESDLIIYADAAKNAKQLNAVNEVHKILESIDGFKSVKIIKQQHNVGLSQSIIQGVTDVLNAFGKAIVLEDDMVTSTVFLTYMNKALEKYNNNENVICIHGYNYPIKNLTMLPDTYFLKGADCWGWATWKRGWDIFEPDGKKLKEQLIKSNQIKEFDFNYSYNFYKMLCNQIEGKNDSWAIRWNASAFVNDKLTLYPAKSLVQNIGLDLTGTHSSNDSQFTHQFISNELPNFTENIEVNTNAYDQVAKFFINNKHNSVFKNFLSKVEQFIKHKILD